ncbi:hypothetical protein Efla_004318 [Eimeria flavescens]
MTGFRSIVVMGASSLFAARALAQHERPLAGRTSPDDVWKNEDEVPGTTKHNMTRVDCLGVMNPLRTEAGLTGFVAPTDKDYRLPIPDPSPVASKSSRQVEQEGSPSDENPAEVYPYFLNYYCKSLFEDVDPYRDNRNISFLGLFSPRDKPTMDCAFVTCLRDQKSPTVPASGSVEGPQENASASSRRRLAAASTEPVYSLLCLSSPQALQPGQAPFTQEQWAKILRVASSATPPQVFGFLAIAVTALAHIFL